MGCGSGRYLPELASRFSTVIGTDISPTMAAAAREHVGENSSIIVHETDVTTLNPLESDSIDFAMSMAVFIHMPTEDIVRANLNELARILIPGGKYLVEVRVLAGWMKYRGYNVFPRRLRRMIPSSLLEFYHNKTDGDPSWTGNTWIGYGGLTPAQTVNMFELCGRP
jgi:SAM-dependent methyltransferase